MLWPDRRLEFRMRMLPYEVLGWFLVLLAVALIVDYRYSPPGRFWESGAAVLIGVAIPQSACIFLMMRRSIALAEKSCDERHA